MKQNRNCSPKNCEVKLQKHSNHIAGKAEDPKTGKTCEAVSEQGKKLTFV